MSLFKLRSKYTISPVGQGRYRIRLWRCWLWGIPIVSPGCLEGITWFDTFCGRHETSNGDKFDSVEDALRVLERAIWSIGYAEKRRRRVVAAIAQHAKTPDVVVPPWPNRG